MPATVEPALWGVAGDPARGRLRVRLDGAHCRDGRDRGRPLRRRARPRRRDREDRRRRAGRRATSAPPPGSARRAKRPPSCGPTCSTGWPTSTTAATASTTTTCDAIAELNVRNAKLNPNSQTRGWKFTPASFTDDDDGQPVGRRTHPPHRLQRPDRRRGRHRRRQRPLPGRASRCRRAAEGRRSSAGVTAPSACRCSRSSTTRPTTRTYCPTSGRRSPMRSTAPASPVSTSIDAIETHDCFSMSEYAAIDHFGITAPGDSWKADRGRRHRDRRPDPGQPQRRPHRRRPPGRRHRRAHDRRRVQAGDRAGRRLPGRGRPHGRHPQHRRQHHDDAPASSSVHATG